MATQTYPNADTLSQSEKHYQHEAPADLVDRKLEQAEALSIFIVGAHDDLVEYNDEIQSNILQTLSDLIRDAKVALASERAASKR